jgi:hypothetical protein
MFHMKHRRPANGQQNGARHVPGAVRIRQIEHGRAAQSSVM